MTNEHNLTLELKAEGFTFYVDNEMRQLSREYERDIKERFAESFPALPETSLQSIVYTITGISETAGEFVGVREEDLEDVQRYYIREKDLVEGLIEDELRKAWKQYQDSKINNLAGDLMILLFSAAAGQKMPETSEPRDITNFEEMAEYVLEDEKHYGKYKRVAKWYLNLQLLKNSPNSEKAVDQEYLRQEEIDGKVVYFPTEKALELMCTKRKIKK